MQAARAKVKISKDLSHIKNCPFSKRAVFVCMLDRLPFSQFRFLLDKLPGDHIADLLVPDQFMDLLKGSPLDTVSFPRL